MKNKIAKGLDADRLVLVARKFSILCHPARTQIINMLMEHEVLDVKVIIEKLTIVPAETMFHLKKLYEAGFISKKKINKIKCYSLNTAAIEKVIEYTDYLCK